MPPVTTQGVPSERIQGTGRPDAITGAYIQGLTDEAFGDASQHPDVTAARKAAEEAQIALFDRDEPVAQGWLQRIEAVEASVAAGHPSSEVPHAVVTPETQQGALRLHEQYAGLVTGIGDTTARIAAVRGAAIARQNPDFTRAA